MKYYAWNFVLQVMFEQKVDKSTKYELFVQFIVFINAVGADYYYNQIDAYYFILSRWPLRKEQRKTKRRLDFFGIFVYFTISIVPIITKRLKI